MTLRISTGLRNKLCGINSNKVTNGTFASASYTGWTADDANTTLDATGDVLTVTAVTDAGYATTAAITVKPGHVYQIKGDITVGSGTAQQLAVGTTAGGTDLASITTAGTGKEAFFRTGSSTTSVYVSCHAGIGENHDYDNIELVSQSRAIQDVFNKGQIKIYTGTQPSSADSAPSGTLLVTIDAGGGDGTGVTWDDAASGVLSKDSAETWSGTCVATGTAGWARIVTTGDGAASSTTDERIDMSVGTSGAQINMSSTAFATGATQTLTSFTLTMPAS